MQARTSRPGLPDAELRDPDYIHAYQQQMLAGRPTTSPTPSSVSEATANLQGAQAKASDEQVHGRRMRAYDSAYPLSAMSGSGMQSTVTDRAASSRECPVRCRRSCHGRTP
jgi:hypothetical protein